MTPLFHTEVKYSFEEYKSFYNALLIREKRIYIGISLMILGLLGLAFLTEIWAIIFVAVMTPFLFWFTSSRQCRRVYDSAKIYHGAVISCDFFEDHLEQAGKQSVNRVNYSDIYNIIETKTHFYIMLAKNQGIIVKKSNCPDGLADFIKGLKK